MALNRNSKVESSFFKCLLVIIVILSLALIVNTVYGQEKLNSVGIRFTAEDFDEEGIPIVAAEDGYYFNVSKASSITLNGAGAKFVKATRKDNGETLIITAELTKIEEFLGEIEAAGSRKTASDGGVTE